MTQLFTEHYMVLFLLHNTIGAWYAGKVLAERPKLAATAKSESELREALRLTEAGGYDFEYLRFVKVDEASSLVPSSSNTHLFPEGQQKQQGKSLEGSSTLEFNWFDWKEPMEVLSGNLPHVRQEKAARISSRFGPRTRCLLRNGKRGWPNVTNG